MFYVWPLGARVEEPYLDEVTHLEIALKATRLSLQRRGLLMNHVPFLPVFGAPPLAELVLGVQFDELGSYTSVNAKDIRELFEREFPIIDEQPRLQPQFEAFGGVPFSTGVQFQFGNKPVTNRLWFVNEVGDKLLQFQSDRFLVNWRKNGASAEYPRFESMLETFQEKLSVLEEFFQSRFGHRLSINQAEISYINLVPVEQFSEAEQWFSVWRGSYPKTDSLDINFNQVVDDEAGKPQARLFHRILSVFAMDGSTAFQLELTFRGKPVDGNFQSASSFVKRGREVIAQRFWEMTTDEAHRKWEYRP